MATVSSLSPYTDIPGLQQAVQILHLALSCFYMSCNFMSYIFSRPSVSTTSAIYPRLAASIWTVQSTDCNIRTKRNWHLNGTDENRVPFAGPTLDILRRCCVLWTFDTGEPTASRVQLPDSFYCRFTERYNSAAARRLAGSENSMDKPSSRNRSYLRCKRNRVYKFC